MLTLDGEGHTPFAPFRSRWILAEPALTPGVVAAYFALRTQVFVREQGLFQAHDRDAHDEGAIPIVAVATSAGMPEDVIGVVRIYRSEPGVWYGGRLAVAAPYRRSAEVGAALIRAAVGSARGLGAVRFFATIQAENRPYFERHAFSFLSAVSVCDRPHVLMEADLNRFAIPAWCVAREAA